MIKENVHNYHTLNFHAGIAGDRLLGPYFLPPRLTGAVYHDIPRSVLPELLQSVDLQTEIQLMVHTWWRRTKFFLAFREVLHNVFPKHWIGGSGPIAWPARSRDLNPLDFHLRRHPQSTVYATEVSDVQGLRQRTQNGFEVIRAIPEIFLRVTQSVFRRAALKLKLYVRTLSVIFRRPELGNHAVEGLFFIYIVFLVLYKFTVCRFGRAFFVHPMNCVCVCVCVCVYTYIRVHTVRNSQRTKRTSARIRKTKRWMLHRETIALCCHSHVKHVNTLCGPNRVYWALGFKAINTWRAVLCIIIGRQLN